MIINFKKKKWQKKSQSITLNTPTCKPISVQRKKRKRRESPSLSQSFLL
jgi:hypothetical protein